MATSSNDDVCTSQPEDRRGLNDSSPFIPKYRYTGIKRLQRIIDLERDLFLETSKRLALAYNDAQRSESRLHGRGSPERRAQLLSENAMKDSSQEATLDTSTDILHPIEGVIELPINFQDLSFRRASNPGLDYQHNSSGIIQFYFVNSQDAHHFISSAAFPTIKFSYLADYAVQIKMPLLPHGTAIDTIDTLIKQSAATMNHIMTVRGFNKTNIPALDGRGSKQADQAWGIYNPPVGARKDRPSIVLEVGLSESQDDVFKDVKFWLDPQRGGGRRDGFDV
ncbi:hypothetical protein N7493_006018 [Penicillium malachiteum]|uniref:Uncharacterized protein n=1 Tax=Penicillium malachiteum TaxID=1324776 RepID=A0AAD6HMB8_9EURO|nr:hypothetical protein N7493_006018 [Penicillium malachiteum]